MSFNYQPSYQDEKMATSSSYAIDMPLEEAKQPLNPSSYPQSVPTSGAARARPDSVYVDRSSTGNINVGADDDQDDLITPRFKDILKIFFFGLLPCSTPGIAIVVLGAVFKKDWKFLDIRLVHWGIYVSIGKIKLLVRLYLHSCIPFGNITDFNRRKFSS